MRVLRQCKYCSLLANVKTLATQRKKWTRLMFSAVFWVVLPCKMISFYTAVQPRRQLWTSYSPPWELEISQMNKAVIMLPNWSILQISCEPTSSYRWPIGSLPSLCMLCTASTLHQGRLHPAGINSWCVDSNISAMMPQYLTWRIEESRSSCSRFKSATSRIWNTTATLGKIDCYWTWKSRTLVHVNFCSLSLWSRQSQSPVTTNGRSVRPS
jgi:hypothetical protein